MQKKSKNKEIKNENTKKNIEDNELFLSHKTNSNYKKYTFHLFIYLILLIAFFGTGWFLVFKSITVSKGEIASYNEIGNADYSVYLKDNPFYEQEFLSSNLTYITKLIDSIKINFNYRIMLSEKVTTNISYDIIGKLKISSLDGQKLYEKDETLLSSGNLKKENTNIVEINDTVSVDYDKYNALASDFKNTLGIETNSVLYVYILINKQVTNNSQTINFKDGNNMNLSIPLGQRIINITSNNMEINNKKALTIKEKTVTRNTPILTIACGLVIFACGLALKIVQLLLIINNKGNKYDKYITKILNQYDRLIVKTNSKPKLEGINILKISNFQELLDARDNLKKPIMYYIVSPHEKSCFYILSDNNCYIMVLKSEDIENGTIK